MSRVMTTPVSIAICVGAGAEQREFEFQQPVVLIGSTDKCDVRVDERRLDGRMIAICAVTDRIIPVEMERREADSCSTMARIAGRGDVALARLGITARLKADNGQAGLVGDFVDQWQNQPCLDVGLDFDNAVSRSHRSSFRYLRRRVTLIGRKYPSHIRLGSESIADVQCCLIRKGGKVSLFNLEPRNAVKVNGLRKDQSVLKEGDEVCIGRYRSELVWKTPEAAIKPSNIEADGRRAAQPTLLSVPQVASPELVQGGLEAEFQLVQQLTTLLLTPGSEQNSLTLASLTGASPAFYPGSELRQDEGRLADVLERMAVAQEKLASETEKQRQLFERMFNVLHARQRESVEQEWHRSEALASEIRQLRERLVSTGAAFPTPNLPAPNLCLPSAVEFLPPRPERSSADTKLHEDILQQLSTLEDERNTCIQRIVRFVTRSSR